MQIRTESKASLVFAMTMAALTIGVAAQLASLGSAGEERFGAPAFVPEWRSVTDAAISVRDAADSITIVSFVDLECPYCRAFHLEVLTPILEQHSAVGFAILHFPLPSHELAIPAAEAAECADKQGRLSQFIEAAFANHDIFANAPWTQYADDAQVSDLARFSECLRAAAPGPSERVQRGINLGRLVGVDGTPAVLVGGWLLNHPAALGDLDRIIRALLANTSPF